MGSAVTAPEGEGVAPYTDPMWERTFLRDLAVVLAASFPVLFVCRRLKLPQIVGFLITGVAIGPHALGWVREASRVESIAEFGVALILLFVGLEFPIRRLKALGRTSLVAGRVVLAIAGVAALIAVARRAAPRLLDAVARMGSRAVSYTHLRAHETRHDLVCR